MQPCQPTARVVDDENRLSQGSASAGVALGKLGAAQLLDRCQYNPSHFSLPGIAVTVADTPFPGGCPPEEEIQYEKVKTLLMSIWRWCGE